MGNVTRPRNRSRTAPFVSLPSSSAPPFSEKVQPLTKISPPTKAAPNSLWSLNSERSIRQWETGMAFPSADNLKKLIAIYLHHGAFAPGRERDEAERRIREKLDEAGCNLPTSVARGLERLASARSRLLETLPQTRAEMFFRWLDEVVVPGRIVGIGRNGRRLLLVMRRRGGNLIGMREDGRGANLALERVGRVYAPIYPLTEEAIEALRSCYSLHQPAESPR